MQEQEQEQVAVRTRDLVKQYRSGATPALGGVDVEVARGTFLSVMGPSGSGKSTLLHLIGGLDRPTRGDVLLDGVSLTSLDDRAVTEMRRTAIGFVFQAFNLVPVLTVADNVALPAVIAGRAGRRMAGRIDQVLDLVGLHAHRDKLPSELSGGEQQRVAIARALLLEPPLLLADEPTGNLDSVTGTMVLELLRTARESLGTTVVMVTHDASAASFADSVLLLRDGHVVAQASLEGIEGRPARTDAVLSFLRDDAPGPDGAPFRDEGSAAPMSPAPIPSSVAGPVDASARRGQIRVRARRSLRRP